MKDNRYGCLWIALNFFNEEKRFQQSQTSSSNNRLSFDRQSSTLSNAAFNMSPQASTQSFKTYTNTSLQPPSQQQQNDNGMTMNSSLSKSSQFYLPSANSTSDLKQESNSNNHENVLYQTCTKLIEQFNNPYLRYIFNYIFNQEEAIFKLLVSQR
jgi:hypothetical protein